MLPRIQKFICQKKTAIKRLLCLLVVFFVFHVAAPILVHAQGSDTFGLQPVASTVALSNLDIRVIIAQIIRAVLGLLGIIALVLILYAGYSIMTAAGNEEKVNQGKLILRNAAIGLAIILSAFAIVQFILNSLAAASGTAGFGGPGAGTVGEVSSFAGSGALGSIIKDHYPFRDQVDVARNTKITVTFREPIDPKSLILDTNGDGIIGNCRAIPAGAVLDWARDCDQLKTDIVKISSADSPGTPVAAAALSVFDMDKKVFTVVFRPLQSLGSDIKKIVYTVDLTSGIKKSDGTTSAFVNERSGHYTWDFTTDTRLDTTPPTILEVYPRDGAATSRNTIVQVQFSEAMDPTVVQGLNNPASSFTQLIFGSSAVTGIWRLTNQYKTVEFVSDQACGQNSCGDVVYCLPAGGQAALVRTGQLVGAGSGFSALPFTGVMDMAGNALDGNKDNIPNGKPPLPPDFHTIGAGEDKPDNFLWHFTVNNSIDLTSPYITQVSPGLDQEDVSAQAPLQIFFSSPLWLDTLDGIHLEEYGLPAGAAVDPIWFRVRALLGHVGNTVVTIDHRDFGPGGAPVYYFPSIPSTIKNVSENCLYPGRGPVSDIKGASPVCSYSVDAAGHVTTSNCVEVKAVSAQDTGCVQTTNPESLLQPDVTTCLKTLENMSVK